MKTYLVTQTNLFDFVIRIILKFIWLLVFFVTKFFKVTEKLFYLCRNCSLKNATFVSFYLWLRIIITIATLWLNDYNNIMNTFVRIVSVDHSYGKTSRQYTM